MNKLLQPPPGIVETVTRYECPRCGNNCQCGVPYVPKTQRVARAAEYAEQNPSASVREIAEQTGASVGTAYKAKSDVQMNTSPTVTGRDGKSYPARNVPESGTQSAAKPPPDPVAAAHKALDPVIERIHGMAPDQRKRFRQQAVERIADAVLGKPDSIYF
jgi:hypothetical protein